MSTTTTGRSSYYCGYCRCLQDLTQTKAPLFAFTAVNVLRCPKHMAASEQNLPGVIHLICEALTEGECSRLFYLCDTLDMCGTCVEEMLLTKVMGCDSGQALKFLTLNFVFLDISSGVSCLSGLCVSAPASLDSVSPPILSFLSESDVLCLCTQL